MSQRKAYWDMSAAELAAATREFDDPNYHPRALRPSGKEMAQVRRWRAKRRAARFHIALMLDSDLVEKTDNYAAKHGTTFSDVVADALRRHFRKKTA